jgi:cell division protein FtsI/penicillin-binding protein 2
MQPVGSLPPSKAVNRVRWVYAITALVLGIFLVRSFYLQVIKHEHYRKAALSDQRKEYEIPAERGIIRAYSGDATVPIVLNQKLYTIYADPTLIKNAGRVAESLAATLGGKISDYESDLKTAGTRYVVIAKRVNPEQKKALLAKKHPGIGATELSYRTYPNGALAAQLLGLVNDEGQGVYGVEEALNKALTGKSGQLKAVTDINGVPLAANTDNIQIAPVPGSDLVLTIDMAMQQQLETILQQGLKNARSDSGSALIIDPHTGAVKAMANWPTFDPNDLSEVDMAVFNNPAVSAPLEVGSVMKPLTTAAALDQGVIKASTSYYDPAQWKVDGFKITNIEEDGGPGQRNIADVLNLSLNTGATWLLMQMSRPGGTEITDKGRMAWHKYMVDHYRLGKLTGIEQSYEDPGVIPDPNDGYARDLAYANTTFGQALTATPLQMASAFAAIVNGGTYYQPRLIDRTIAPDGKVTIKQPKVLKKDVVKPEVSNELRPILAYVVDDHYFKRKFNQQLYTVGGKTGTAEIAKKGGGYLENEFNGTYLGFVGGDLPQYVIAVVVHKPRIGGYAGSQAAQPIFGDLAHMLIDNFGVTPKGQ